MLDKHFKESLLTKKVSRMKSYSGIKEKKKTVKRSRYNTTESNQME